MSFKYFTFFGEVVSTESLTSKSVDGKFDLAKPDFRVLTSIKTHIELYGQHHNLGHNIYETEITKDYSVTKRKLIQTTFKKLPKEKWKYIILSHDQPIDNRIIPLMLALSNLDLTSLLQGNLVLDANSVSAYQNIVSGLSSSLYFHDHANDELAIKNIEDSDFAEMSKLFDNLNLFEASKLQYPKIDKALDDFLDIQHISKYSPFKILNYITIFELLLSDYDPKNQNNTKISEQLKEKLHFINEQCESKIEVKKYFKGPDTLNVQNIIYKLYAYRSNIAHGKEHDFNDDLQIFKGKRDEILSFLRDLLKNVIKYALDNPKTITELGSK